jgi:hypothetical protein
MKSKKEIGRARTTGDIGEDVNGQYNEDEDIVMDPFKIAEEIQKSRFEYQRSSRRGNSREEIPNALSKD